MLEKSRGRRMIGHVILPQLCIAVCSTRGSWDAKQLWFRRWGEGGSGSDMWDILSSCTNIFTGVHIEAIHKTDTVNNLRLTRAVMSTKSKVSEHSASYLNVFIKRIRKPTEKINANQQPINEPLHTVP